MALTDFTPSIAEVAAHMPARVKEKLGGSGGVDTFTDKTRPTKAQVEARIPLGVSEIAPAIGATICEGGDPAYQAALYGRARNLAALAVACICERGFWPEQVGSERSPYKQMREDLKDGLATLVEAVAEHCGGGGGESVGGPGPLPSSSFPPPSGIGEACW